jgi:hypothetical protein
MALALSPRPRRARSPRPARWVAVADATRPVFLRRDGAQWRAGLG